MLNNLDHKILMYILEEKRPISNKELALQCDVAINTIRKRQVENQEAADRLTPFGSLRSMQGGGALYLTSPRK